MFLSIVTPCYNTEKYIPFCLESVLKQNIQAKEYEIICVDDGSSDSTGSILDEFSIRYPNLIVVHKYNAGVSVVRNNALDMMRGDYLWFIDSDDFIEANILSDIYKLSENKPERIQLNMYHMKSDYFSAEEEKLYRAKKLVPGKHLICSAIYRSECIKRHNIRFHPELRSNGDLVFGYELRKSIGGYKKVVAYEPVVYYYRNNGMSISNTASSKKLNSSISLCAIMHKHALEDNKGFAEYTMVRYLYFSYFGICQLSKPEREKWINLMRQKGIYPVIVGKVGAEYYRKHYKSMKIRGINTLIFRFVPTPIGYAYVRLRTLITKAFKKLK